MSYSLTCPRCGDEFVGDDREGVADQVIEHARGKHGHALDREIVIAHLDGVHPFNGDD